MRLSDIFEDWGKRKDARDFRDSLGGYEYTRDYPNQPNIRNWPPTAQQMRDIERQVLQDPDWLKYWARFGWTSFTYIPDGHWDFDYRHKLFRFEEVPHIGYLPKKSKRWEGFSHPLAGQVSPDRKWVYCDLNGRIVSGPYKGGEYSHMYRPLQTCIQQIKDFVAQKAPEVKRNLKWITGNYYIRFGLWPKDEQSGIYGPDHDPKNPRFEKGVSAYHARFDVDQGRWALEEVEDVDAIAGTMQTLIYGKRDIYLVQGDELDETGADGEPLLRNVKLIKRVDRNDVFMPGVFDPKEDLSENATKPPTSLDLSPGGKRRIRFDDVTIDYMPLTEDDSEIEYVPDGSIYIHLVMVPSHLRGKGVGYAAMKKFLSLCDKAGKSVCLYPIPHQGFSLDRFYGSLGFQSIQDEDADRDVSLLVRHPR